MHTLEPRGLLRSPFALFVVSIASLALFELLHRVLGLHPLLSTAVIMLVYVPLLLWAIVLAVSSILADPEGLAHAVGWAIAFAILLMVYFAVIYSELGIVRTGSSEPIIRTFTTCLYFSAATFTTLGYGDFAPTPDARLARTRRPLGSLDDAPNGRVRSVPPRRARARASPPRGSDACSRCR